MKRILVLGSQGQIGTALSEALRQRYGHDQVVCSDIRSDGAEVEPFVVLDVLDKAALSAAVEKYQINTIYHLAAILSANGERNPSLTWKVNMEGLLNVLNLSIEKNIGRVFFPSSIAIYGPSTPKVMTQQESSFIPTTVYGISKLCGENWCNYFHKRYGLDVRSLRYPGVVGYQSVPTGGTTDYAVEIFHAALNKKYYQCFLKPDTALPMIYIDDAIRATMELMEAESDRLTVRTSYNLAGMTFTPAEIYASIKNYIPDFEIEYRPDFRQQIAESWAESIDDTPARMDWGWRPFYDLEKMTQEMLQRLSQLT